MLQAEWRSPLGWAVRRRDFIKVICVSATAWPLAARAQQPERMRRIGVLMAYAESDPEGQALIAAFREGLQKLGWTEGRNIRIDTRWAAADTGVDATIREGTRRATARPHSFADAHPPRRRCCNKRAPSPSFSRPLPIRSAAASSRASPRPGGNVTGFTTIEGRWAGKWLELLKEIAPRVNRVAFLFNPATATFAEYYLNPFKAAAASFAVEAIAAPVHDTSELESVIAAQAREPNGGLIVMPDTFTDRPSRRDHIAGCSLPSPCRLSVPFLR